ncbi:MAG: Gldg family protein [Christensenellales bacterium]
MRLLKNDVGRRRRSLRLIWPLAIAALICLMILGAQTMENRHALRRDFSFNQITTQGEVSRRVLEELTRDVHVYALFTPGQEDQALIGLLERFQAGSAHFSFSLENLAQNPGLARSISSSLADSQISNDCLIVFCRETGRTRVLNGADYISQSYDTGSGTYYVSGLNYEKGLSEALVFVSTQQLPTLQVLTGHGELGGTETGALDSLLERYNYALVRVDLRRQETLDPAAPLMILSPQKDLSAAEAAQIDDFCRAGGALFITWDYAADLHLPNFLAVFMTYGFEPLPGMVIAQTDAAGSYIDSPAVLMPYMESTQATLGMLAAGQTSLILAGSAAFREPAAAGGGRDTQVVLRSGNAYLSQLTQDGGLKQQPGDLGGTFPLALLADIAQEDGTHTRAFIIGNSSVFTDSWLQGNTYSAEFLLNIINYLAPGERIQLAIPPKDALRQPLRIPSPWLVDLALILLPCLVAAAAGIVLLPRRRL